MVSVGKVKIAISVTREILDVHWVHRGSMTDCPVSAAMRGLFLVFYTVGLGVNFSGRDYAYFEDAGPYLQMMRAERLEDTVPFTLHLSVPEELLTTRGLSQVVTDD